MCSRVTRKCFWLTKTELHHQQWSLSKYFEVKKTKNHAFHWFFIDFHWFSLVFIDFHWNSNGIFKNNVYLFLTFLFLTFEGADIFFSQSNPLTETILLTISRPISKTARAHCCFEKNYLIWVLDQKSMIFQCIMVWETLLEQKPLIFRWIDRNPWFWTDFEMFIARQPQNRF